MVAHLVQPPGTGGNDSQVLILRTSVVIATRNRAALLRRCVEAVAAQEKPPGGFEVLIVDSASTDQTPRVADELAQKYAGKVRAVREDRPGLSRARNRALRETEGELLAFLDDDAVPQPRWLHSLVKTMDESGAVAVGGRVIGIWPAGAPPRWLHEHVRNFVAGASPQGDQARPYGPAEWPGGGNSLIRRQAIEAAGGFNERLGRIGDNLLSGEEVELFQQIARTGLPMIFAPDAVIHHQVHGERLRPGWIIRRMWAEGVSRARIDPPPRLRRALVEMLAIFPLQAMANVLRLRPNHVINACLWIVHHLGMLLERARQARTSWPIESPGAAKVAAVFPLLPDPTAFLARIRARMPNAEITFYTANAEAENRAQKSGVSKTIFRPLTELSPFVPALLRKEKHDLAVMAFAPDQARHYVMFLVQTALWRRVKKIADVNGVWKPFSTLLPQTLWLFTCYVMRAVLLAVLVNLLWILALPLTVAIRLLRGAGLSDAMAVFRSTRRSLGAPAAYVLLNPDRPLLPFLGAASVLADLIRGPTRLSNRAPRRLLLIRLDHLGDLIATTGILSALKAGPEPWEITMIVGPWGTPVLRDDDRIDKLLIYPTRETAFARDAALPPDADEQRRAVRRWLKSQTFDVVVDPISGVDQTRLAYLPRAAQRITTHANRWFLHGVAEVVPFQHETPEPRRLVDLFARAGLQAGGFAPSLRLGETTKQEAASLLGKSGLHDKNFLALHTGGAWEGRRWPLPCFVDVARRARERFGFVPAAFFGPDEAAAETAWLAATKDIGGRAFRGAPLPVVFAVISRAAAFIGNDSGLLHAAAAGGVSSLGIFGPGDLARWTPQGRRAAAVSLHFPCSPCYQSFCTDPRCLLELDVDLVWPALVALIERGGD